MHLLCFKGLENSKNEVFVSFDTTFFYLCAFIWHIFLFLVYISPLFTQTLSNQSRNETGKPNLCSNLFHFKDLPLGWTLRTKSTQGRQLHFFSLFPFRCKFLPDSNCIISAVQCHKVCRCPILLSHYCPHIPDSALVQSCGLGKCISISDLII